MLSGSQRTARVRRSEILGWPVVLSLALHLSFLSLLLIIPPTQAPPGESEPLTVDVVVGEGAAGATSEPPAPTEAAAEPWEAAQSRVVEAFGVERWAALHESIAELASVGVRLGE